MKLKLPSFLISLLIACLEPSHNAHAVNPPPDGGYSAGNTAEGDNALLSLTSGSYNTAIGFLSLKTNSEGNFNTAVGAGALLVNSSASENTATGAGALLSNASPFLNSGNANTADGAFALFKNITGSLNTAIGDRALFSNTTGAGNIAVGSNALANNTTSSGNIALGNSAGSSVTTASNVISIGSAGGNSNNACFIGNIWGAPVSQGSVVVINSFGKLGTSTSSRRFKEDIKPMDDASEAIYLLKPVSFRYKKEIDPQRIPQFGLVAEEVEELNPELVVRDADGKPYSVRYDQVNAMLLNEFLKEHRKVEEQARQLQDQQAAITQLKSIVAQQQKDFQATAPHQQKQIEALAEGLQKVSAQLEVSKPAPQTVNKNQ